MTANILYVHEQKDVELQNIKDETVGIKPPCRLAHKRQQILDGDMLFDVLIQETTCR